MARLLSCTLPSLRHPIHGCLDSLPLLIPALCSTLSLIEAQGFTTLWQPPYLHNLALIRGLSAAPVPCKVPLGPFTSSARFLGHLNLISKRNTNIF